MSELINSLETVCKPIYYKGCNIVLSNGKFYSLGVPHDDLLSAKLTIDNAATIIQGSLNDDIDEHIGYFLSNGG